LDGLLGLEMLTPILAHSMPFGGHPPIKDAFGTAR
jgi:hypothetical protein